MKRSKTWDNNRAAQTLDAAKKEELKAVAAVAFANPEAILSGIHEKELYDIMNNVPLLAGSEDKFQLIENWVPPTDFGAEFRRH